MSKGKLTPKRSPEERRALQNEQKRQWRQRHPEIMREYIRRHRAKHRERIRAYRRRHYAKNREHIRDLSIPKQTCHRRRTVPAASQFRRVRNGDEEWETAR
jgi:hypothetical protein